MLQVYTSNQPNLHYANIKCEIRVPVFAIDWYKCLLQISTQQHFYLKLHIKEEPEHCLLKLQNQNSEPEHFVQSEEAYTALHCFLLLMSYFAINSIDKVPRPGKIQSRQFGRCLMMFRPPSNWPCACLTCSLLQQQTAVASSSNMRVSSCYMLPVVSFPTTDRLISCAM